MQTITVSIEVTDEKAVDYFHDLIEEWSDVLVTSDEASLSLRVRQQ